MTNARLRLAVRSCFLGVLLVGTYGPTPTAARAEAPPAATKKPAVVTRTLPAASGVRSEARTVIDAPAEEVATLLRDPHNFVPLFPAHAVDVLESAPDSQVIAVEMRKPWPVGTVKWVEDVVSHREAGGKGFVVERSAHPGYFKHMSARWLVTPDPAAETERCIVTYEVAMELQRWAPEWMLRRGNLNGILDTMSRLRTLVSEKVPKAEAAAATSTPAASPSH